MNKLLTITEAAQLLKVHPETLRRWDREGVFSAIKVNSRGDRRYSQDTITDFMKNNKDTIKYADPIEYQGYSIKWDLEGITTLNASFDRMARFIVKKDESDFIGFIFYISFLSVRDKDKDGLELAATERVKEILSSRNPTDGDRFTFEFANGQFVEVENPSWWEEKYSKSLLTGLRVVAEHSCPYSLAQNSWRVILRYKCKQGVNWLSCQFGKNKQFYEYYTWINSEELKKRGLPNIEKSAEVLAVEFGIDRFEKTGNAYEERELSKINENNAAYYDDEWHINEVIPEKYS